MLEWVWRFDIVTFTLSEFGCFDDESDNLKVLTEAARVLKKGGYFLLDIVANRDNLVQSGETVNYLHGDGYFVAERGSLDLVRGIHKRAYRWYDEGQLCETEWQIRVYTPSEIGRMLEMAGFEVVSVYGGLTGEELLRNSVGMTFIARNSSQFSQSTNL